MISESMNSNIILSLISLFSARHALKPKLNKPYSIQNRVCPNIKINASPTYIPTAPTQHTISSCDSIF